LQYDQKSIIMKNLCCVLLALFTCYNLVAQNDENIKDLSIDSIGISISKKPKTGTFGLYADVGTIIVFNTVFINFEGRLVSAESNRFHLYGRLGFGKMHLVRLFVDNNESTGGIAALTMLIGKEKHYFEGNLGVFIGTRSKWVRDDQDKYRHPVLEVGYRYQKPGKGIIVRVKIGTLGLGLGLGYAF
jgi:hypothetical protein